LVQVFRKSFRFNIELIAADLNVKHSNKRSRGLQNKADNGKVGAKVNRKRKVEAEADKAKKVRSSMNELDASVPFDVSTSPVILKPAVASDCDAGACSANSVTGVKSVGDIKCTQDSAVFATLPPCSNPVTIANLDVKVSSVPDPNHKSGLRDTHLSSSCLPIPQSGSASETMHSSGVDAVGFVPSDDLQYSYLHSQPDRLFLLANGITATVTALVHSNGSGVSLPNAESTSQSSSSSSPLPKATDSAILLKSGSRCNSDERCCAATDSPQRYSVSSFSSMVHASSTDPQFTSSGMSDNDYRPQHDANRDFCQVTSSLPVTTVHVENSNVSDEVVRLKADHTQLCCVDTNVHHVIESPGARKSRPASPAQTSLDVSKPIQILSVFTLKNDLENSNTDMKTSEFLQSAASKERKRKSGEPKVKRGNFFNENLLLVFSSQLV